MIDILRKRRSCRKFTSAPVEPDKIAILKEAALRSPASRNINPWHFVFVDDRALIQKLAAAKEHGSAFLKNVSLAVVVCADTTASDVWVENCSIASIILQLTAQSLNLGSCWIQIRNRFTADKKTSDHYVKTIINAPENYAVESMIAIGHPAEYPTPIPA